MSDTNASKKGTIELYEGISKQTKVPYSALVLKVGTWSTIYFPKSKFEMDYIKEYLTKKPQVMGSLDLDDEQDELQKDGLFI